MQEVPFPTLAATSISRGVETTDFVIIMTFSSPITMTTYGNISLSKEIEKDQISCVTSS